MSDFTSEYIIETAKKSGVRLIHLQFTDIFGSQKSVAITIKQLEKALKNKCMFDGSSIEGFARIEESDMYLVPDKNSFVVFPDSLQLGKTARLICDVYNSNGEPFEGDPRQILRKTLAECKKMGYTFDVGPECEFFLFPCDEKGRPILKTDDVGGYFDMGPVDIGEICRRDICLKLEDMGFEIEASHHECAAGQHEIDFKYDEALKAADNIMTFKQVVKTVAQQHNLHATFMPKPVFAQAGSGMHINMSLNNSEGKNIFGDADDPNRLSHTAYNFVAGILEHARGICAVANPLVNSYKRLLPGYEAPIHIAWSAHNRSPLVRIPTAGLKSARAELRSPDPSANPYLCLALCLAAGLDGIKKDLMPPDPIDMNIYELDRRQWREMNIATLPESLDEALTAMSDDDVMMETLGEHAAKKYLSHKKHEWREFCTRVSSWEIEKYFAKY